MDVGIAKLQNMIVRVALYRLKGELEKATGEKREFMLTAFQRAYDATYELDEILTRYAPK